MIWMAGLAKQIGYAQVKEAAAFVGAHWHLNERELYAVSMCLDERDSYLYEFPVSASRPLHNLPPPEKYEAAENALKSKHTNETQGPSIWIPDDFKD